MATTTNTSFPIPPQLECSSTKRALLLNGLLNEPLLVLIGIFAVILVKEFDATAWQISVYTALRPVMSLLAFYLSSYIIGRRDRLIPHLLVTGILCRLPFFLFPWIESGWTMIVCAGFYLLLSHSGLPAWIEILKINLPDQTRGKLFSTSAVLGYVEGLFLAILLGNLLKHEQGSWRWLFPIGAVFGILSILCQARIPIGWKPINIPIKRRSLLRRIVDPCKLAWHLLKRRPDFRRFQLGFMGCGSAIMLIYAIMPHYFIDQLQVSYKDVAIATAFFKAVGYACSSSSWVRRLQTYSIFRASSWIFLCVSCFPALLLISSYTTWALWGAFAIYGVGLAGNHLIWHMSAPLFSAKEDSSLYSSVNVLMIGLRGLIFPMLGGWMGYQFGFYVVLWTSLLMCLASSFYMGWMARLMDLDLHNQNTL